MTGRSTINLLGVDTKITCHVHHVDASAKLRKRTIGGALACGHVAPAESREERVAPWFNKDRAMPVAWMDAFDAVAALHQAVQCRTVAHTS